MRGRFFVVILGVLLSAAAAGKSSIRLWRCDGSAPVESDVRSKSLEETLSDGFYSLSESIDIRAYRVTFSELFNLYIGFLDNNPQFFHVVRRVTCSHKDGYVTLVYPSYRVSCQSDLDVMMEAFETAVNKAVARVDVNSMGVVEQALLIHDYLILNCAYGGDNDYAGTAYGALVDGVAVCEGYTAAYTCLMQNMLGFACEKIISSAMNHSWNMLTLDGVRYHVDVTWDDSVSYNEMTDIPGYALHLYFLKSNEYFLNSGGTNYDVHYEWTPRYSTGNKYDSAFWNSIEYAMPTLDGDAFCFSSGGELRRYSLADGTYTTLCTMDDAWPIWSNQNLFWLGYYAGIVRKGNLLIFNGPEKIYVYDLLAGGEPVVFATLDASVAGGFFYSLWLDADGDKIRQRLSKAPTSSGTVYNDLGWVSPESMALSSSDVELEAGGESVSLTVTVLPDDASYTTPVVSNTSTAVVSAGSEDGKLVLTPLAAGTATVTVTLSETGASAACDVVVRNPGTYTVELSQGWNFIAPPIKLNDSSLSSVLSFTPFTYEGPSLVLLTSQSACQPFWLFCPAGSSVTTLELDGLVYTENAWGLDSLASGWNVVGVLETTALPDGMRAWRWQDGLFLEAVELVPANAYLVWQE